jgi:autotransporter-associated beta strand protein
VNTAVKTDGSHGTTVASGATLQVQGGINVTTEALTINGTGLNNQGALVGIGNDTWGSAVTLGSSSGIGAANTTDNLAINAAITDNGSGFGVTKTGFGTVQYTGSTSNTYTGLTSVNDGTLQLNKSGGATAISGNLTVGDGTVISEVQTVTVTGSSGTFALTFNGQTTAPLLFNATATQVQSALNGLPSIGGVGGSVSVTGTGGVYTVTFGGTLGGSPQMLLDASGIGGTFVSVSEVTAGVSSLKTDVVQLLGPNQISSTPVVTVNSDGLVDLGSQVQTLASLTMNGGTVSLTGAGSQLTVNGAVTGASDSNGNAANISGVGPLVLGASTPSITVNGPGVGSPNPDMVISTVLTGFNGLSKGGSGILSLAADNTFTGTTTVNQGTLRADGPDPGNTLGNVVLNGGTIGGTGTVGTITSTMVGKGTINPGDTYGTLNSLDVTLNNTDQVFVDLAGQALTNDLLNVTGNVTLGSATLGGTTAPSVQVGDTITIIQATGNVNGAFNTGTGSSSIAFIGGEKFTVQYNPQSVVLTHLLASITSMTLTPSVASPVFGQPITFTITLTPEPGAGPVPNGEPVTVTLDGNTYTVPLFNDVAVFDPVAATNQPFAAGQHTISASYAGDGSAFGPASVPQRTITVSAASTQTILSSSSPSAVFGQTVTITAAIKPVAPGAGIPTGTVLFAVDGTTLNPSNPVPVDSTGKAVITLPSNLSLGQHRITASFFTGDSNFTNSSTLSPFIQTITRASVNLAVTGNPSPSALGQTVTFTATASAQAPGSGIPTGTVTFSRGSTVLKTLTLDPNGVASFMLSTLPAGSDTITVSYSGDTSFNPTTTTDVQVVNQGTVTVNLTSSAPTSVFGQPVTFTALVSPVSPASIIPTGSVRFKIDGVPVGPGLGVFLDGSGRAVLTVNNSTQLSIGSHTVVAIYGGDTNYQGNTAQITQNVGAATTTTVTSSAAGKSPVFGTPITFTATVKPAAGSGTPTGSVTFAVNGVTAGVSPLSGGVATITLTTVPGGPTNSILAQYNGDNLFAVSLSPAINQAVTPANSQTTLAVSPSSVAFGQPVTLTATVADASIGSTGTPGGSVSFLVDGVSVGSAPLNPSGVATLSPTTISVGVHSIVASYPGNGSFNPSQSAAKSLTVTSATAATLTASPLTSVYGQPVLYTVSVATNPAGGGTPTGGTVALFVDFVQQGTATLTGGQATFTVNNLIVGMHTVAASYGGNGGFGASVSNVLNPVVNTSPTTTTITSSAPSAIVGQTVTYTIAVTGASPSTAHPSSSVPGSAGTVTLFINFGKYTASAAVDATGHATLSIDTNQLIAQGIMFQGGNIFGASFTPAPGNFNFAYSADVPHTQLLGVATSTTVAASANPAVFGQSVVYTATVTPASGFTSQLSGDIVFYVDGVAQLNPAGSYFTPVNSAGQASLALSLGLGNHNVWAVYALDVYFANSTSPTIGEQVLAANTVTSLGASTLSSFVGDTVVFTATVSPAFPSTANPSGTVIFYVNGIAQTGPLALNGANQATISLNNLPQGNDTVTAIFTAAPDASGNLDFNSSSASLTESVGGGRRR